MSDHKYFMAENSAAKINCVCICTQRYYIFGGEINSLQKVVGVKMTPSKNYILIHLINYINFNQTFQGYSLTTLPIKIENHLCFHYVCL